MYIDDSKVDKLSEAEAMSLLDTAPDFLLHRLQLFPHAEEMGGLHIVGTERHESRRIDNQLRGRSGRQGDHGSSRFFISLEDPLMMMFAGKTTMAALSKLGMKEGDAIEHRWITRSVERAQRKVEERNFEVRKNLLEYDEVMEHQRQFFYGTRQDVLEGKRVEQLIFDYIGEAVDDAVGYYKDPLYAATQAAEWCRQELGVSVEPDRMPLEDLQDLQAHVRKEAQMEARSVIDVTLGEYMSNDLAPEEWDLKGLQHWAMSQFSVDVKQNQLRQMNVSDVKTLLMDAAVDQVGKKDLSGIAKFMDKHYGGEGPGRVDAGEVRSRTGRGQARRAVQRRCARADSQRGPSPLRPAGDRLPGGVHAGGGVRRGPAEPAVGGGAVVCLGQAAVRGRVDTRGGEQEERAGVARRARRRGRGVDQGRRQAGRVHA
ncbi:MAG: hypothetical protein HC828_21190 [Blastochloris sp.]|nr:hypothetical protein [Blastochloris sp.]